jgi:hypothetical protein
LEALVIAVERGLRLPLVYNTSAYDSLESIQWMDGIVDIYMPDFKLWNPEHCRKYLVASDYADAARKVIAAMQAQVGELSVDENGLALRGVLVRHLVMPSLLDDTREIMRWIAEKMSPDTYVNVMDQYYPAYKAETEPRFADINRGISAGEFCGAIELARTAGLWRFDTRWRHVIPHGAPSGCRECARSIKRALVRANPFRYEPNPRDSCFTVNPAAAFAILASASRIFFFAACVLPQRGWNFPSVQELLSRDRGFL